MARKQHRNRGKPSEDKTLVSVAEAQNRVMDQHMASPWFLDNLSQKLLWQALFARTTEAASLLVSRTKHPDLFNSYLILGSRWFSHHQSVEMLLGTGRYGDCMILLRSLLEDTDLMTYFALYPEEASDWLERLSRAPIWSDEVYRKGTRKFSTSRIWEKLKAKGLEPSGERDYPILSATVHASPWGARFYGRTPPGDQNRLSLSLAPEYDAAATVSLSLVLAGTYPRPIESFLNSCVASKAPKSLWRSIKARYDVLIANWQAHMEMHSWFRSELDGVEKRISQGEDPDAVLKDLRHRIDEKYGEASNNTQ